MKLLDCVEIQHEDASLPSKWPFSKCEQPTPTALDNSNAALAVVVRNVTPYKTLIFEIKKTKTLFMPFLMFFKCDSIHITRIATNLNVLSGDHKLYQCSSILTNQMPEFHCDMRHITVITAWLNIACSDEHVA